MESEQQARRDEAWHAGSFFDVIGVPLAPRKFVLLSLETPSYKSLSCRFQNHVECRLPHRGSQDDTDQFTQTQEIKRPHAVFNHAK
jgi:hypothetical protein